MFHIANFDYMVNLHNRVIHYITPTVTVSLTVFEKDPFYKISQMPYIPYNIILY